VPLGDANERGMMMMGKTGQPGLKRHRNIGNAEIEKHQTEAAGA